MRTSMSVLRQYADVIEAETVRIRLSAADIDAYVTGTDNATALSMGGAATFNGVRLEVASADYDRAVTLLQEDERKRLQVGGWVCGRCDEPNESTFELCWCCTKPRDESDQTVRFLSESEADASPTDAFGAITCDETPRFTAVEDNNPYRPVLLADDKHPGLQPSSAAAEESIIEDVKRIYHASLVGVLLLPPLLNFYSLYLWVNVDRRAYQDPTLRWRLFVALGINMTVIPASLFFWTMV